MFEPARRTVTVPFVTDIGDLPDDFALSSRFEMVNDTFASSIVPPSSECGGYATIMTLPSVFVPETTQSPIMCSVFES